MYKKSISEINNDKDQKENISQMKTE